MNRLRSAFFVVLLLSPAACSDRSSSPTTAPSPPPAVTIYEAGTSGVSNPVAIKEVNADYPAAAIANRIQGNVLLSVVVLADGTIGEVIVLRSLDTTFGVDAAAVLAARQWLFKPGMKDGVAVAVRVRIEMTFVLRD